MKKILVLSVVLLVTQTAWGFVSARPRVMAKSKGFRQTPPQQPISLRGLQGSVRVVRDGDNIPHIYAGNDRDAFFIQGYLHASDRFFQMDLQRRQAGGTLAELVGPSAVAGDIQFRNLGLRRAAQESLGTYPEDIVRGIEAYAAGVNAYLRSSLPLPPEYTALELTRGSIPPWTAVDSLAIGKLIAFSFVNITGDIGNSTTLAAYQRAGQAGNFDGTRLFFEDVNRSAPFESVVTLPGFFPTGAAPAKSATAVDAAVHSARRLPEIIRPETLDLAEKFLGTIESNETLKSYFDHSLQAKGSNWWVIAGRNTVAGNPLLASDPHLSLSTPSVWYEAHLVVQNDPVRGPMNVNGVTFPGIPGVVTGANERVTWGVTVNSVDVSDAYQEEVVIDPVTRLPRATVFAGREEPVQTILQNYRVNTIGDRETDNLVAAAVPAESSVTVIVPRRNNGPLVSFAPVTATPGRGTGISLQMTGFRATRELESFLLLDRARSFDDFRRALQFFDVGSQNFSYADVDGNIGYIAPSEIPLRDDLQNLGRADGTPPFLLRDGTGRFRNEWIPSDVSATQALRYAILPFNELPQAFNPAAGFLANANQDPVGTVLGNNPLGRTRVGGTGIYYLSPGYADGNRMGRIVRLIQSKLANGGKISMQDMQEMQGNHQMLDAEILVPNIIQAFQNARATNSPASLAALANDPRIAEAVDRLGKWDFGTPTGIKEGYDPGDDPTNLADPTDTEIQNSVAATIYSVWRGRMIANTIDATLGAAGLGQALPSQSASLAAVRNLLDTFSRTQGRGASGLNFFNVAGAASPQAARDTIILQSIRDALDALAGNAFAAAFNNSRNQNDYRWGRLHRITFSHPLGGPFSIPTAGGFTNLASNLPGLARSGGFEVVDASTHAARMTGPASGTFGSGASRRMVVELSPAGVRGFQIIPGGQTSVLGSPFYANQVGRWLTTRYHPMYFTASDVEANRLSETIFEPRFF